MSNQKQPPLPGTALFTTYRESKLYILDANIGHRRHGWDHATYRYMIADVDPYDNKDRGLQGHSVEALVADIKTTIDLRRGRR